MAVPVHQNLAFGKCQPVDIQQLYFFLRVFGHPGDITTCKCTAAQKHLIATPFAQLSPTQLEELIELGKTRGLKMHKFKKTMGLARVRSVIGILRTLQPTELLDIGSGRGVFVWPFLEEFPVVPITCVDLNPIRVRDILAVRDGGIQRLSAVQGDIATINLPNQSFDVVTFLEALEHIPDAQSALDSTVRIARRFVVLSVPSHDDDNEEHIHLFNKDSLRTMLAKAGAENVNVQYVLSHMILVANVMR
jgi:ubiquinone/menaquinone biosynthesis C-methylase UbiE